MELCGAFLTTAGAASGHSEELSLAVVGLKENELQQLVAHQGPQPVEEEAWLLSAPRMQCQSRLEGVDIC